MEIIPLPKTIFLYCKELGWKELQETGDYHDALIFVVFANLGYNVFRDGDYLQQIAWSFSREEAIEIAVERVQYEHAKNELYEQQG